MNTEGTSRADESPKLVLEGAAPSLRANFARQIVEDEFDDMTDLVRSSIDTSRVDRWAAANGFKPIEFKTKRGYDRTDYYRFMELGNPVQGNRGLYTHAKLTCVFDAGERKAWLTVRLLRPIEDERAKWLRAFTLRKHFPLESHDMSDAEMAFTAKVGLELSALEMLFRRSFESATQFRNVLHRRGYKIVR